VDIGSLIVFFLIGSVGQLDNLMFWTLVQNQNLFSLDRFWTDHIKKLILARVMVNFGQYLISTKLLIFKKLYKSHINTILIINQVYEFNKLFSSSLYFYNSSAKTYTLLS
jgi:hypothetical protein